MKIKSIKQKELIFANKNLMEETHISLNLFEKICEFEPNNTRNDYGKCVSPFRNFVSRFLVSTLKVRITFRYNKKKILFFAFNTKDIPKRFGSWRSGGEDIIKFR